MSEGRLNALFLGAPDPVSMGIARGWQLAGHRIAAIWYPEALTTAAALEKDRAMAQTASALAMHGMAERGGVAVRAVPRLAAWPEVLTETATLCVDVVISALFMDRIPRAMLSAFPGRVVNLHPSLLPAYRGRWPLFNMLWDRTIETYGGMSLHVVEPSFDTGDIIAQTRVAFPADAKVASYNMHLIKAGAALLNEYIPRYFSGALPPAPQSLGDAPQGARKPSQAVLTSEYAADHMAWLCATIPQITPLGVAGLDRVGVSGFFEEVGEPTGAPPQVDGATVTLDASDRRVRLRIAR